MRRSAPRLTLRSLIATGLGALGCAASVASADTFSVMVDEGRLVVDGRWIEAPFPVVYTTRPPGIAVANVPVVDDEAAIHDMLGLTTTPATQMPGESHGRDGRGAGRDGDAGAVLGRLATEVVAFVLERVKAGDDASQLEQALGRFLLRSPDVIAAEIGERTVRVDASLAEAWALELRKPDDATITRVLDHVERRLGEARAAARTGAVYEDGVPHTISDLAGRDLVAALLSAGSAEGATPWLARALGRAIGTDVAARAVHAHLVATRGASLADDALAGDYPAGAGGVWLLTDDQGRVALACRDVALSRLASRLGRAGGIVVNVGFADRERRITFFSDGFRTPRELLPELAGANALAVRRAGDAFDLSDAYPFDTDRLEREGQLLWRVPSLHTSSRWVATTTSRLIVPVRLGGIRALRWRTGGVAWQLPGPQVPFAVRADRDGRLYVADASGAVARLEFDDGRIEWRVHPPFEAPTLGPRARLRVLDASRDHVSLQVGDAWLVTMDSDDGSLTQRVPFEPGTDPPGDEPLLVPMTGALVAIDPEDGALRAVVRGPFTADARVEPVRGGFLVASGTYVLQLDESLATVARVALGELRAWAATEDALLTCGVGSTALVRRRGAWDAPIEVPLPAAPQAAFAADGALYVSCSDGRGYRIDPERARVRAVLEDLEIPPRVPVAVHGVAVFYPSYGGRIAAYRVR